MEAVTVPLKATTGLVNAGSQIALGVEDKVTTGSSLELGTLISRVLIQPEVRSVMVTV